MNITRTPIKTEYKVNQIGHYKELVIGSGTKVFKANSAGVYAGSGSYGSAPLRIGYDGSLYASNATITGVITATSGTFTGTIYATAGEISGNLIVSGSLYSDKSGTVKRTQLIDGEVAFLASSTKKGVIRTSGSDNGLLLGSSGSIYFTDLSGNPNAELTSDSALKFSNDNYISWASGRKITATGSEIQIDGDFRVSGHMDFTSDTYIRFGGGRSMYPSGSMMLFDGHVCPNSDTGQDCGTDSNTWRWVKSQWVSATDYYACQGSNGTNKSGIGFVTSISASGGQLRAKYREITTKGGIVTEISGETGWVNMGGY